MNLATIEARTYARLGWDAANPGTAIVTRIRGFINETYRELIGRKGFDQYRRQMIEVIAWSGEPIGAMSQAATRIYSIRDTDNDVLLSDVSLGDIRQTDPGDTAVGNPTAFAIYNLNGAVLRQPTIPTVLYVKSTSASDNSSKRAYVQGVDQSGFPVSVSAALNGITEVQLTTTVMVSVTKFYIQIPATTGLSAITTAAGQIRLYQTTGGTDDIASIAAGRSSSRYVQIRWFPTPAANQILQADVELVVNDLVEEGDEPILPEDFHWLLSSGAVMKEYARREKPTEYAMEKARFKDGLGDLVLFANKQPASTVLRREHRWSQLGPYFPSGT